MGIIGQLLGRQREILKTLDATTEIDTMAKLNLISDMGRMLEGQWLLYGGGDVERRVKTEPAVPVPAVQEVVSSPPTIPVSPVETHSDETPVLIPGTDVLDDSIDKFRYDGGEHASMDVQMAEDKPTDTILGADAATDIRDDSLSESDVGTDLKSTPAPTTKSPHRTTKRK